MIKLMIGIPIHTILLNHISLFFESVIPYPPIRHIDSIPYTDTQRYDTNTEHYIT